MTEDAPVVDRQHPDPHAFVARDDRPAYCALCNRPRVHKVHPDEEDSGG